MRLRAALLAATVLPGALLTAAAGEVPDGCKVVDTVSVETDGVVTDEDVLACASATYVTGCEDAAGGKVWVQAANGVVPVTDFTAPAESFTAGAGCGTYDEPLFFGTTPGNPFYDITFDGYVVGNLDELIVELHDIYVGPERTGGDVELAVRVEVDGVSLFGVEEVTAVNGTVSTTPTIINVPITPEVSETGVSEALRFSVGGLYDAIGAEGVVGTGDDVFHTVRVTVSVPIGGHAIVWGASEIPSGLYVNQGTAGTILQYGTGRVIG